MLGFGTEIVEDFFHQGDTERETGNWFVPSELQLFCSTNPVPAPSCCCFLGLILSRCRRRSCTCKNMPPRNVQDWIPWKSWFRSPKTSGMMLGRYAVVSEILGGVKIFKTSILRKRILRGNLFIVPESAWSHGEGALFLMTKTPARHWWISHKMGHNHRCPRGNNWLFLWQYFHGGSGYSKVVLRWMYCVMCCKLHDNMMINIKSEWCGRRCHKTGILILYTFIGLSIVDHFRPANICTFQTWQICVLKHRMALHHFLESRRVFHSETHEARRSKNVPQAHTFGRILRLLVKVTNKCGPKALLSPMVARREVGDATWES